MALHLVSTTVYSVYTEDPPVSHLDLIRSRSWFDFDPIRVVPLTEDAHIIGRELYSHDGDAGLDLDWAGENINVVNDTAHATVVAELHQKVLGYIQLRPIAVAA